jgi:ferredoxin-NADP reductase
MAAQFPFQLVDSFMVAPDVRHLRFQRTDGATLGFIPGQFLQIHFEANGAPTKRSYSLANAPSDSAQASDVFEIAVSYVKGGAATALLSSLEHGQSINASGPYGRFCLQDNDANARYVLIGTGTGITPYRAMLPQLAKLFAHKPLQVALIQGARTEQELLYGEEFQAFAQQHPQFHYWPCTSRQDPSRYPRGLRGHVQTAFAAVELNPTSDIAYLCGNPNMVDESFNQMKELGFPVPLIRREKYISSK